MSIAITILALAVAGALILGWAWILSWRIAWGGLKGSDSTYHLHLANWVATTFPYIDWWYRWDGMGMSYREAYPMVPSWLVVGVAQVWGWTTAQSMQAIQFLINPLCAIGMYAFGALRMRNRLLGLAAGLLYLISPIVFTFLLDWGFFANQVGTVLFMPSLFALDVFWEEWQAGRRGARLRITAVTAVGLVCLTGLTSPTIVGAPLVVIALYALACPTLRMGARWLFVVTPILGAVIGGLSAFWGLTLFDALGLSAGRAPAPTYDPQLSPHWDLSRMLQLLPMRSGHVEDKASFAPEAWVPAVPALLAVWWDARVRVLAAMAAFGFIITSVPAFDQWLFGSPVLDVLNNRVGLTLVQFAVPMLGAYGLAGLAPILLKRLAEWRPASRLPRAAVIGTALAFSVLLIAADLDVFASSSLPTDLWLHHVDNPCNGGPSDSALCGTALAAEFNVLELANACLTPEQQLRTQVEVCADLGSAADPRWSSSNDAAIGRLVQRCAGTGGSFDPVCAARLQSFLEQASDLSQWRTLQLGCYRPACTAPATPPATWTAGAPQRSVVDAHAGNLLQAFHDITGGGQFYTYLEQDIPSPELDDYMKGAMLDQNGAAGLKAELAAVTGADAVVLTPSQAGLAAVYQSMGWQPAPGAAVGGSQVYLTPNPSGLASQWTGGTAVLVVGQLEGTPSHPYNDLFKVATQGLIPFGSGWLVRSRSPYIDDYSSSELSAYPALLLLAYRYHDATAAWQRLDDYVREGGHLFVETGWQYTDPDWNLNLPYAALPVTSLRWGPLETANPPVVEAVADRLFGSLTYQGGGWGASSAPGVRAGAEPLVRVGDRIAVARWNLGRGRVLWSGMNLIAHSTASGSADEAAFLARQLAWLLGPSSPGLSAPAHPVTPSWTGGDEADLALTASTTPSAVLFKESMAPGWSAELVWPGGSRSATIEPSEMDFMLVRLDSIPNGAQLVFRYGPTGRIHVYWTISALVALALLAWLVRPSLFGPPLRWGGTRLRGAVSAIRRRARWEADE